MRSSTMRCPPASAIAIAIAMPALRASRMAVATMCLAPSWVRRLASAIYMEVVPLLWGTSVTIQGGPVDRASYRAYALERRHASGRWRYEVRQRLGEQRTDRDRRRPDVRAFSPCRIRPTRGSPG